MQKEGMLMMTPEKLPTKKNLSALDEYINKVYILVLLLVPGACECAGLAYTFSKMMGWLPTVSWAALIIFDLTCLINQEIAASIRNENKQFNSINAMAENNAKDTTEVATQAGVINDIVAEMKKLLNQDGEEA